jgi:hypothetical protein
MHKRILATLATLTLIPMAACSGPGTTSDETSYQIEEAVTALVVDARAAAVTIVAGDGPITVREVHRYSDGKPATTHAVAGGTLTLTETGCGNDDARCEVQFHLRMPAATSTRITGQAGAVKITGMAGDVQVSTQAGAVEGKALTGDQVDVQSEAGAASLEFAEAPMSVKAVTQVGAIAVHVPGDRAYAVNAATNVGATKVSVRKDATSRHHIDARTDLGATEIEPLP